MTLQLAKFYETLAEKHHSSQLLGWSFFAVTTPAYWCARVKGDDFAAFWTWQCWRTMITIHKSEQKFPRKVWKLNDLEKKNQNKPGFAFFLHRV